VCYHDDPALSVVGSRQKSLSIRGGADWEGKWAMNKDLRWDRTPTDVKLGHALQKELQIILKVFANSGVWKQTRNIMKGVAQTDKLRLIFVVLCLTGLVTWLDFISSQYHSASHELH